LHTGARSTARAPGGVVEVRRRAGASVDTAARRYRTARTDDVTAGSDVTARQKSSATTRQNHAQHPVPVAPSSTTTTRLRSISQKRETAGGTAVRQQPARTSKLQHDTTTRSQYARYQLNTVFFTR